MFPVSLTRSGDEVSVQNVVLGELIKRRGYGYGYELRDQMREFSEALGYSDTFVYAALVALEKQGLVAVVERGTAEPQTTATTRARQSASRVYYEVTEDGRRRFRDWMAGSARKLPLREELHMQLMAAEPDDLPHLIATLSDFDDQCRAQLRQIMEKPLGSHAPRGRAIGATLVHDALVSHLQTSMEWAQRTRTSLQNLLDHPTGVPGRRRP
jgi:DNA-binding PadR family transcriptional regulator